MAGGVQHKLVASKMELVASGQMQTHRKWGCTVLSEWDSSDESDSD